jgi:AraC-like DNA-binding protein/mannose-6-phosphate isomerase-like protein (cupin superfamily)
MEINHRVDSKERQHYLFRHHYALKIKPRLLYVGKLDKKGGWREKAHSHEFCEIMYVADGHGTITIGKTVYNVHKGDIIIYNAELVHEEESSSTHPMALYFMGLGGLRLTELPANHLLPPGLDFIYPSGKYAEVYADCFERMIPEFEKKEQFYAEITQNLAMTMLMYTFRLVNEQNKEANQLLQSNANIRQAIAYIQSHLSENLTLDEIARQCHMSKFYLSHQFTQTQGISLSKYILKSRITSSMRLLRETLMSVKEIAEKVGFNDVAYFCRAFKTEVGMTPLQYRKQN